MEGGPLPVDAHIERTYQFGEKALGYLKYNETAAIPRNYELWYTYASGVNPQLIKAIQEALSKNSKLSVEDTDSIYEAFLSPHKITEKVEQVGSDISSEVKAILHLLETTASSTGQYGESLEVVADELTDIKEPSQLKPILASLIEATTQMASNSRELEVRLEESHDQIEKLNASLETIRMESMTDQLTNIPNRKLFDQTFKARTAEAESSGEPLCLLMLDIDHFKKFNDNYGHQTGDQVLRLVAHAMKSNVKGRDLAARYGGEEFAIILPQTTLDAALTVAEQIRLAIMNKELVKKSTGEKLGRITVSIGAALYNPGEPLDEFMNRADTCLYAAKHAGRNQVKSERDDIGSPMADSA